MNVILSPVLSHLKKKDMKDDNKGGFASCYMLASLEKTSTMKLYYHEDGRLLYSRHWPEVPPVKISIYADEAALRSFKNQMEYLLRYPVVVTNPDKAFMEIVWSGKRVKRGEFYEINNCFEIKGNTVTIL